MLNHSRQFVRRILPAILLACAALPGQAAEFIPMSFFFHPGAAVEKPVPVPAAQTQDFFMHVGGRPAEFFAKNQTGYLASCEYTGGAVTGVKTDQAESGFALSAKLLGSPDSHTLRVRVQVKVDGVGFSAPESRACMAVKPSFVEYVRYDSEVSLKRDGTPLELALERGATLTIKALGQN